MAKGQTLYDWCMENGEYGQQLLSEWTGIDDYGAHYERDEITKGSNKKMLWKCKDGHEWYTSVHARTNGTKCPLCANVYRSINNKISKLKVGTNDLYTWCMNHKTGKQLLIEFGDGNNTQIFIDDNNNKHNPSEYSFSSHEKIRWTCNKGHSWSASIKSRTQLNSGCPYCNHRSTSYPEQFIYWSLKQIYPNTENRCKVLKSSEHPQGIEFDIGIPYSINGYKGVCIEYSPTIWHSDKEIIDEFKMKICKDNNIKLIYIREDSYNELEEIWSDDFIQCRINYNDKNRDLYKLVKYIVNYIGHNIDEIDFKKVIDNAIDYSKGKIEYEKTLEYLEPELSKEWHKELNRLKPDEVTPYQYIDVYWHCPKCDFGNKGEWVTRLSYRTNRSTGCPKCGWNYKKQEQRFVTDKQSGFRIKTNVDKENTLSKSFPELVKEWNYNLNDIDPASISSGSHLKVYWTCTKCGYGKNGEWIGPINRRTAKGYETGCPQCGWNWKKQVYCTPPIKKSTVSLDKESSYTQLAKEWNTDKNFISINEITHGSRKTKVYWRCINCNYGDKEDWLIEPRQRSYFKLGCPRCGYNWYRAQTGQPQKLKKGYTLNISSESEPIKIIPKSNLTEEYGK